MLLPCYCLGFSQSLELSRKARRSYQSYRFYNRHSTGPTRQIQPKGILRTAPKIFTQLDQRSIEVNTSRNGSLNVFVRIRLNTFRLRREDERKSANGL